MPFNDHVVSADAIRLKRSSVAGEAPSRGSLRQGEVAVNTADGTLYVGSPSGSAISVNASGEAVRIVKTGEWQKASPGLTVLSTVPAQSLQLDGVVYTANGPWLSGFTHTESSPPAGARLLTLSLENLAGISGSFNVSSCTYMTSFKAPALKIVAGTTFAFDGNTALTNGSEIFPALIAIFASNTFLGATLGLNTGLVKIELPELVAVGTSYTAAFLVNTGTGSVSNLTAINMPKLAYAGMFVVAAPGANSFTTFSFPSLKYLGMGTFQNAPAATTVSLPSLVWCDSGLVITTGLGNIENVTLPVDGRLKGMTGNVSVTGQKLTEASVNNICKALALLDGTGGTTSFGTGRTLNLSGGTSAIPTPVSTVTSAGSNFVCSGTTCTATITAHGYSTGDVLGISGITTATNANRYAVITKTGDNTFTYTITSQSATGAGTATIRKANDDVKAIVTRGATVTFNT